MSSTPSRYQNEHRTISCILPTSLHLHPFFQVYNDFRSGNNCEGMELMCKESVVGNFHWHLHTAFRRKTPGRPTVLAAMAKHRNQHVWAYNPQVDYSSPQSFSSQWRCCGANIDVTSHKISAKINILKYSKQHSWLSITFQLYFWPLLFLTFSLSSLSRPLELMGVSHLSLFLNLGTPTTYICYWKTLFLCEFFSRSGMLYVTRH